MSLKLFNTLTRTKEEFVPLIPGMVSMYVCGPTVYDYTHIGHAKSYISFDILLRYLRYLGYKVRYVQNITDVGHLTDDVDTGEDKIVKRAKLERIEPMELVELYTRAYFEDMDALNIVRPDISPRASGHVPEQIELIKTLLEKGYAYEVNGSVYFDILKFPKYGELTGRKLEEQIAGSRVKINPEKRNPADFALWIKADPSHILRWNSPWSWGYPYWHLECSAMSMKYLGETIDIHGGGLEHAYLHHACEIAQSEAATGKQFVRYWVHHNMVTINGMKMGKSLGNAMFLKELFQRYPPMAIRFFVLTGHYRSPQDFSETALEAADKGLQRLYTSVGAIREKSSLAQSGTIDETFLQRLYEYKNRFLEAMDDDLNTAVAISILFDLTKEVNTFINSEDQISRETLQGIDNLYRELGGTILGIVPDSLAQEKVSGLEDPLIELLVKTRKKLRQAKQWDLADDIREGLSELGIIIEDRSEGTAWKLR